MSRCPPSDKRWNAAAETTIKIIKKMMKGNQPPRDFVG